ncbi:hypothetical protein [Actinoallomurus oryzae]|uniref:hypothetical protein n=1 Tax=Actinoallomurus oryzae TaxID=502180 RepID=UPI0031EF2160
MSGARRIRGRHARAVARMPGAVSAVRAALAPRRTQVAVAGGTGLSVALTGAVVAFVTLVPADTRRPDTGPKAAAVNVLGDRPAQAPVARSRPESPGRPGDQAALAFYERKDPVRAAHVTEVIWTGPMLRVYTDLPASDANSRTAMALCEIATAYAEDQGHLPEVFVHADRAAGYPVLANKMNDRDDCRLDRVP